MAPFVNNPNESFKKLAEATPLPSIKSVTSRMIIEDTGNLWVQTNEEKEDAGETFTAYDIFNIEGIYEPRVWLRQTPGLILRGKMYLLETDKETGYRLLKKFRIIWNTNQ